MEGEFKNGNLDGKGKITQANGMILEGEFKNGNLDGKGKITKPSGIMLEGEFKDNEKNGVFQVSQGKNKYIVYYQNDIIDIKNKKTRFYGLDTKHLAYCYNDLFDNGILDFTEENNQLKKHFGVDINFLEIPTELNKQTNQGRRSISEKINNMNNNSILFVKYPEHLIDVIKYDDKIYSIGNPDSEYFDGKNHIRLDTITNFLNRTNNIDIRNKKQIPYRTGVCVNYAYFLAHAFIKFLNEKKNLPFQEYYIDLISRYSKKGYTFEQAETSLATEIKVGMVNRLINIKEDIQKTIHKKNNDDNVSIDSSDIKLDIKESDKEDNIVLDYYVDLYRTADKEDFLGQLKNLDIKNLEKIKNEIDDKLEIITEDNRLDFLHRINIEMPKPKVSYSCFEFFKRRKEGIVLDLHL